MLDEFRSTLITWDKATSRIYSPVTANASDENGRKLVVQIVNSGQVEDLTGATLHLYWETRDKAHDGLDVFDAVDLKKGEFELSYTTGMLSNKGALNANLVLIDAVGRVVSERFKITVTEGIDNDAIQSENSFTTLTQALIDISNLEQKYAPRLNDLTAQLQQTFKVNDTGVLDLNVFNETARNVLQGQEPGTINAVLGKGNVKPENTSFMENISNNVFTANKEELSTASGHVVDVSDGLITLDGPGGGATQSNVTISDTTQLVHGTYTFILELVSGNRKNFQLLYTNNSGAEKDLMTFPADYHKRTITDSVKSIKIRVQPNVSYDNLKVRIWANEGETDYPYQPIAVFKLNEKFYDKSTASIGTEFEDSEGNKLEDLFAINNLKIAQESDYTKPYTYTGEKINLKDFHEKTYHYDVSYLLEMEGIGNYVRDPEYTFTGQGFTIHNDIAFMFYDSGYCRTIDLISKTEIALFALPERRLSNHAGQANFGVEYATGNDQYPVLYLSSYQENLCYVYSITTTGAEIVQKIYIENGEAWFIDKENDKMIVKMGGLRDDGVTKYKYYKVYDLPTLSEGYEITYTDDYASDNFYIRTGRGTSGVNYPTAGFAKEGKLYVPAFQNRLMVYDYFKHVILTEIKFTDPKLTTHEYEQVCEYNGKLVFNFNGGDYLTQMEF